MRTVERLISCRRCEWTKKRKQWKKMQNAKKFLVFKAQTHEYSMWNNSVTKPHKQFHALLSAKISNFPCSCKKNNNKRVEINESDDKKRRRRGLRRGKGCRDINIISAAVGKRKTLERHCYKNASLFHRLLRCGRNTLYQFLSTFAFVYRYFVVLIFTQYPYLT